MNTFTIIVVVSILVVAAAGTVLWLSGSPAEKVTSPAVPADDFPPKPKWKPAVPVDIEKTIQTFAYYTDNQRSFVVFTNGTCVLLPNDAKDAEAEAVKILDAVYNYHPDFNPQSMDDGNFLVSYSQPAYSVVFTDEFETNRAYINANHLDGIVRDEVLLNADKQPNVLDDRGKIGLFGRARMFLDAQNPKVVRVWKPQ